MINDLFIVIRVKEGDIKSFESLFRSYYLPLLYYSTGITGREDISEEIIQEFFYNLWKNRQELKITKSIKSYLFNSIRNRSIDYCRKRKYEESPSENLEILGRISEEPSPVELMEAEELNSIIKTGLKKMPARRRDIFLMSRLGNKKHEEIASLLSLSVKTVEAEMGKALKLLKKETGYTR
ncbi:MAG: RNA polymerase sigma-70 factor [Bacteroidales bacterium]|nr:RNA polymerase sigma-70 factor [Bacteroidales bacterium]